MLHLDAAEKLQENTEWARRWFTYFGGGFFISRLCFGKIEREKKVEIGSSENLVTSQCCTIQQSPERDRKFSQYFMHTLSLRLSSA